jgi:hypothetical protein
VERLRKVAKVLRIVGALTEIRTEDITNPSQDRYRLSNPLGI